MRIAKLKKSRKDTTATIAAAMNAMPRKNLSVINAMTAAIKADMMAF